MRKKLKEEYSKFLKISGSRGPRQLFMDDVLRSPGLVHYIYIFGGSCHLMEFCHVQNSLCVKVLRFPILAPLLHGTPAAGVSQSLRRGTRNGITELSQKAPPIFGWTAIMVGHRPTF